MRTRVARRDRAADGVGPLEFRTRPAASLTSLIRLLSFVVVLVGSVSSSLATETAVSDQGWLGQTPFAARPQIVPVAHHGAHVVVGPSESAPRVGPSYLFPDPTLTPGALNPDITQANIHATICNPQWSTKSIRPTVTYTNNLKKEQLANPRYKDKTPSHYEEDHLISLELGGNPTDRKNLWPEMWGTLDQPLTSKGPFPPHLVGAKAKDAVENQLHKEVCAGRLTLQDAQRIIAIDWFKYYRDHVMK